MSDSLFSSERERKCLIIVNMYRNRRYTQAGIAKELHMRECEVRKVLQAYGFEHTKEKSSSNPHNLNTVI